MFHHTFYSWSRAPAYGLPVRTIYKFRHRGCICWVSAGKWPLMQISWNLARWVLSGTYRSDRYWSTPVNRFRCAAKPNLSPCHRQGHGAYYSCSRYCLNATWSTNLLLISSLLWKGDVNFTKLTAECPRKKLAHACPSACVELPENLVPKALMRSVSNPCYRSITGSRELRNNETRSALRYTVIYRPTVELFDSTKLALWLAGRRRRR